MEPPKPEVRARYMAAPNFSHEDEMEYERLLAERFATDPDLPKDPASEQQGLDREKRIQELHMRIYGALP